MKKILLGISFFALQLFAVQCTEQQYSTYFTNEKDSRYMYSYLQSSDNSKVVIDKKSIIYDKKNKKITCWTISQMFENPKYAMINSLVEFNLENNQYRILAVTVYDCKGKALNSTSEKSDWDYVTPDSGFEITLYNLKQYLNIKQ